MPFYGGARKALRRSGFDIVRFPNNSSLVRRGLLLKHFNVGQVLDVGANSGGYAGELRSIGYKGCIHSFEPLERPFQALLARSAGDSNWEATQVALGQTVGAVSMGVAGNGGASSSLLPMLERHRLAAPEANFVGTEVVDMTTLDLAVRNFDTYAIPTYLKIDVQGFEEDVLLGAKVTLGAVVGVQIEMSLIPLYEGAFTYDQVISFLEGLGFQLSSLEPGFWDHRSGELLQVDGIFFR